MRIPIVINARAVVRSWQTEEPAEPEVRYTGYGPDLDLEAVAQLIEELSALTRALPQSDAGLRQFDQRAARLLGERLLLPPAVAADRRFCGNRHRDGKHDRHQKGKHRSTSLRAALMPPQGDKGAYGGPLCSNPSVAS